MQYNHFITGRIIRKLRKQRGITQEVLSGLAAISRSHLAEIETGRTSANVDTLWRIAQALDMPLSDLIRMVECAVEQAEKGSGGLTNGGPPEPFSAVWFEF